MLLAEGASNERQEVASPASRWVEATGFLCTLELSGPISTTLRRGAVRRR